MRMYIFMCMRALVVFCAQNYPTSASAYIKTLLILWDYYWTLYTTKIYVAYGQQNLQSNHKQQKPFIATLLKTKLKHFQTSNVLYMMFFRNVIYFISKIYITNEATIKSLIIFIRMYWWIFQFSWSIYVMRLFFVWNNSPKVIEIKVNCFSLFRKHSNEWKLQFLHIFTREQPHIFSSVDIFK